MPCAAAQIWIHLFEWASNMQLGFPRADSSHPEKSAARGVVGFHHKVAVEQVKAVLPGIPLLSWDGDGQRMSEAASSPCAASSVHPSASRRPPAGPASFHSLASRFLLAGCLLQMVTRTSTLGDIAPALKAHRGGKPLSRKKS